MNKEKQEWDKHTTPKLGISDVMQRALDWWHELPIQNLQDMNDSWVGYLWKYYPDKSHPYHLTGEEVQHIYESEHPQFWEKVENFYQILEIEIPNNGGMLYELINNDMMYFPKDDLNPLLMQTLGGLLDKGGVIMKVRCLINDRIFSVGDNVYYEFNKNNDTRIDWVIDNFYIRGDGTLLARSRDNINVEYLHTINYNFIVTEDGEILHEGEYFYPVCTVDDTSYTKYEFINQKWNKLPRGFKAFSTIQAAKKYIFENKPQLSIKDVEEAIQHNNILTKPGKDLVVGIIKTFVNSKSS